jgi:membrane-associated phospholipid phosphatase
MKSRLYFFISLGCVLSISISCDKEVEGMEELRVLHPASTDADAGTWQMILMTSPDQVTLPPPAAVNSASYQAELADIKEIQNQLTDKQRTVIAYWSVGGVLRWNQLMRGLVAKYNLLPAPNPDGTYPTPDAENPFANPEFPFANPPYSARAYSYVSVAQYEALKAAWSYKFSFNRPAPYTVDDAVKALVPTSDLPAYPSEDAVISGVTSEMLKVLFPAAVEEITLLAAEQRNAAIWSGKASYSDVSAGLALGKAVATILTANSTGTFIIPGSAGTSTTTLTLNLVARGRFRTDGMGAAIGTPTLWKELQDSVGFGDFYKTNQKPWLSLEEPARPPMLPNFGKVTAWMISPDQLIAERPQPPSSTASQKIIDELAEVKSFVTNPTREQMAIVHKWADGVGTYTPPGHWNDIAAEYVAEANMSEVRAARAFALLNMALHNAGVGCWETKYYYFNPRPSQLDPSIKTLTGIPNFPSYTSGHSTFSGAASDVLSYLFPQATSFFEAQASEASLSRLFGGIHYRVDCDQGLAHGKRLATYTIAFALNDGAD